MPDTLLDIWQDALEAIRDAPVAYVPVGHVPGPARLVVDLYLARLLDLWDRDETAYAALSPLGAELLKVEIDERGACDDPALGVESKREVNRAPLAERATRPKWETVEVSAFPFDAPRWSYRESDRRAPRAKKYERERPLERPDRLVAKPDAGPEVVTDEWGNALEIMGIILTRPKPQRKPKAKKRRKAG